MVSNAMMFRVWTQLGTCEHEGGVKHVVDLHSQKALQCSHIQEVVVSFRRSKVKGDANFWGIAACRVCTSDYIELF